MIYTSIYKYLHFTACLCVCVLAFGACKHNQDNHKSIKLRQLIPDDPSWKIISIEDYIYDLSIIPLEEREDILITPIWEFFLTDNFIGAYCNNRAAIFIFDKNGKYVDRLLGTGSGPEEFENIFDIDFEKETGILYFLDLHGQKIIQYDVEAREIRDIAYMRDGFHLFSIGVNGEFLYAISNDFSGGQVKVYDKNTLQFTGKSFVYNTPTFAQPASPYAFRMINDTLFMSAGGTDTIYYCLDGNVLPYLTVGDDETGFGNYDRREILNRREAEVAGKLVRPNKEKRILIPYGSLFTVNGNWMIHLHNGRHIYWDRTINKAIVLERKQDENHFLFFMNYLAIQFEDKNGYAYSTTEGFNVFYNALDRMLEKPDHHLYPVFAEFNKQYPRESRFENPIILKYKFDTDKLREVLQ